VTRPYDEDTIREALRPGRLGRPLYVHDAIGSTSDEALDLLHGGAPHGAVVVADEQVSGRGRRGTSWHSPKGVGVYASVVLRGAHQIESPTAVVAAAGLGLAEGIEAATGLSADIKWPNDLWYEGRKLAGILVESRGYRPEAPSFVAGFGVNVNHRPGDFPREFAETATSVAICTGERVDRVAILAAVLEHLEPRVDQALGGRTAELEDEYRARSCLRGRDVTLLEGDRPLRGTVEDLSATEGLLLRLTDGTHVHVRAEHAREVRLV
jgi:BirA family biotin operon repressor/biotin-[acetyl-CoA-carboxylase] ligase